MTLKNDFMTMNVTDLDITMNRSTPTVTYFPFSAEPAEASGAHQKTSRPKAIRVLLVDDHPVVRKGVAACLAQQNNIRVIGEAGDGEEAVRKAKELEPDLVLMDIDMPRMDGLAAAELLRKENPRIKVLILSMHTQTDFVMRILKSGARGYILKAAPPAELIKAIESVHAGESFFSPDVARAALNQYVRGAGEGPHPAQISNREREVLIAIAEGLSNKEIAVRLGVGVRTVETHRERIMRKLDIHSVAGLTRFAIQKGLITLQKDPESR